MKSRIKQKKNKGKWNDRQNNQIKESLTKIKSRGGKQRRKGQKKNGIEKRRRKRKINREEHKQKDKKMEWR